MLGDQGCKSLRHEPDKGDRLPGALTGSPDLGEMPGYTAVSSAQEVLKVESGRDGLGLLLRVGSGESR